MQPYFAPYLGYFRLFSETDLFVVLDDVQQIRRGFMHRNRMPDSGGNSRWLTLPMAWTSQYALIKDLHFAEDAVPRMVDQVSRFPALRGISYNLYAGLMPTNGLFVPYAMRLLRACCDELGIRTPMIRSSDLEITGLTGQDRILEICRRLGATHYVNAPGGSALYDKDTFAADGIELSFLPAWNGPTESVLYHLAMKERKAA